jgi:hypothetical protein
LHDRLPGETLLNFIGEGWIEWLVDHCVVLRLKWPASLQFLVAIDFSACFHPREVKVVQNREQ